MRENLKCLFSCLSQIKLLLPQGCLLSYTNKALISVIPWLIQNANTIFFLC